MTHRHTQSIRTRKTACNDFSEYNVVKEILIHSDLDKWINEYENMMEMEDMLFEWAVAFTKMRKDEINREKKGRGEMTILILRIKR